MDMQDCVDVSSLPPIDGETASFLRTDFTVSCVSARYNVFWHASQVLVGVYVVGVPVTYAVVLWYKRRSLWFNQSDRYAHAVCVAVALAAAVAVAVCVHPTIAMPCDG